MKTVRYMHSCFVHSAVALCAWLMSGVCSAWEAAAGHLSDAEQGRRACGAEDAVQSLRLRALYQLQRETCGGEEGSRSVDLFAVAYRLAEKRYREGLAPLRVVYETGAELFAAAEFHSVSNKGEIPTRECLNRIRQVLTHAAESMNNREDWLKTELLWFQHIEPDGQKVRICQEEWVRILQRRYQDGLIPQAELSLAALDGQGLCLFTPPGDGVRQRAEAWAKEAADLYCRLEKTAAASEEVGYQFHELLFRARLRLLESETVLRRVTQTNLQSTTDCH